MTDTVTHETQVNGWIVTTMTRRPPQGFIRQTRAIGQSRERNEAECKVNLDRGMGDRIATVNGPHPAQNHPMTVADLLTFLQTLPDDLEVFAAAGVRSPYPLYLMDVTVQEHDGKPTLMVETEGEE